MCDCKHQNKCGDDYPLAALEHSVFLLAFPSKINEHPAYWASGTGYSLSDIPLSTSHPQVLYSY